MKTETYGSHPNSFQMRNDFLAWPNNTSQWYGFSVYHVLGILHLKHLYHNRYYDS